MPIELLQAYLNKKVTVVCNGQAIGFEGTLVKIEDNWLMLDEKKSIKIINGDDVNYITIKKEA